MALEGIVQAICVLVQFDIVAPLPLKVTLPLPWAPKPVPVTTTAFPTPAMLGDTLLM